MKLMTKEIAARLPKLRATSGRPANEVQVVAKFFTPWTHWTWFVTEGEKQEDGDTLFFGYVVGQERELGYFSLSELESIRGPAGLKIERDIHFPSKEVTLAHLINGANP